MAKPGTCKASLSEGGGGAKLYAEDGVNFRSPEVRSEVKSV